MAWYAAKTQANRERLAVSHLERQGFHVWLPCCQRFINHARKSKRVSRPLFPGYLFVNIDLEMNGWRAINSTVGVQRIVSFGKVPSPVNTDFIEALKANENSDGFIETSGDGLVPGQEVEILTGPMAGQIGKLLRLDSGNRVTVLLRMLGHFVKSQVGRGAVAGM